jgi:hypothetical protein
MITMELTEKEARAVQDMREGYFKVTYVHRNDLVTKGFNPAEVTDEQMEELAEKMGEAYTGSDCFWIDLDIIAKDIGIPRQGHKT